MPKPRAAGDAHGNPRMTTVVRQLFLPAAAFNGPPRAPQKSLRASQLNASRALGEGEKGEQVTVGSRARFFTHQPCRSTQQDVVTGSQIGTESEQQTDKRTLNRFARWCRRHGHVSLPASRVALESYLIHLADSGKTIAALERDLTVISQAHVWAGYRSCYFDPEIKARLEDVKNRIGHRRIVAVDQFMVGLK